MEDKIRRKIRKKMIVTQKELISPQQTNTSKLQFIPK
jgi:hypothetical protein